MDNDLMARRLRPPYEPTPANDQSLSQPSPWDVHLADDGSFAPNEATPPQQDPPFAPPDPAARADIPWDRPAPEAWPPAEDSGTDYSQAWSAQPAPPAPEPVLPAWPAIDPLGDAAPWDTPASALDPDDAMAPVVADVDATAGPWHEWTDSGAEGYAAAGGNGSGYADNAADGANGFHYAITSQPESMIVAAQGDQPHGGDEPRSADEPPSADEPRPDAWADALDTSPVTSDGPLTPEFASPAMPEDETPTAPHAPWEQAEGNAEAQAEVVAGPAMPEDETPTAPPAFWAEAEANSEPQAEVANPEAQAEVVAGPTMPEDETPTPEYSWPTIHGDETATAAPWAEAEAVAGPTISEDETPTAAPAFWVDAEANSEAQAEVVAGPTMPEDETPTPEYSWPTIHEDETATAAPWEQAEGNAEAQTEVVAVPTADTPEPTAVTPELEPVQAWALPAVEPVPAPLAPPPPVTPEPEPEQAWALPAIEPVPAPLTPPQPAVTPIIASAEFVPSPSGSPQSMVLRIELAIVDESQRANPADAARRVGPDADARAPQYDPRPDGDRAPLPWPDYLWNVPPIDVPKQQRGPRQAEPRRAWPPAPVQPTQLDWDLPQLSGPGPDQPAPWSTPQRQPQLLPPVAPPPSWALTQPTPPSAPEPPQFAPPSAPRYQQPAWPPSQSTDPLYGLPAAPNEQPAGYSPAGYQPAPQSPSMPAQVQYPVPSVQSAPAAGWRARIGLPAAASAADDDAQPMGRSSSVMTAGLTIGFALLVIVLVLVFVQLMTSLLR